MTTSVPPCRTSVRCLDPSWSARLLAAVDRFLDAVVARERERHGFDPDRPGPLATEPGAIGRGLLFLSE
jgi:hypothetical protein